MLPCSIALKDWINPEVLLEKNAGFLKNNPFEHIIIRNFFKENVFKELQIFADGLNQSSFIRHPNDEYAYTGFSSPSFFKFMFSDEFKLFLKLKTNLEFLHCQEYPFPQLYLFDKAMKGISVHTDFNSNIRRDFGMIFYLHKEWNESFGGELGLFDSQNLQKAAITIQPIPNTMVAFRITPASYHNVSASNLPWVRKTIVVDWNISS